MAVSSAMEQVMENRETLGRGEGIMAGSRATGTVHVVAALGWATLTKGCTRRWSSDFPDLKAQRCPQGLRLGFLVYSNPDHHCFDC